ncbi:PAS domain-containing hybrid sensor histidine kinase/response regulator [Plebeiibacterium marinum]|uniref:histidine kinase n=1 Tax=Plebeiibacterium marinum TaxID=2992111 RepID=A0AAE3SJB2_9BACT|nr:hybrid sensor histidine kinase/response regulator [Plebeiobacterium marinum]MCW3805223.1 ATP-binding protein [Plebeiobacterium marinum]
MELLKPGWDRQMQLINKIANSSCSFLAKACDNQFEIISSTNCISVNTREGALLNSSEYALNEVLSKNSLPISSYITSRDDKYQSFLTVAIITNDDMAWGAIVLLKEDRILFDYEAEKDVLLFAQIIADQINLHQVNNSLNSDKEYLIKDQVISYFFNKMLVVPWCLEYKTGNFTYIGNQGKKILGYDSKNWKTIHDWSKCIHPEDRERITNLFQSNSKKGKDHFFEYRLVKKNGDIIWIRHLVKAINTNDNNSYELTGLFIDITSIKENEQHLTALNNQLKYILNATNTFLSIVDNNDHIIFHSHEDIKKINVKCYQHFANRQTRCTECPLRNMEKTKSIFYDEINHKTYQVTAFPFEVAKDIWHMAEVRIDITDRIERENEIVSLKKMLEFNMEAGNIGYFEYNFKENTIKSNNVFNTITGYNFNGEPIQFEWLLSRFHPDDVHTVIDYFAKAQKGSRLNFECRILHADNKYIWISYSGQIVSYNRAEGKPLSIAGIIKEITSSKQLLQDLVFERNKSLKASEAKSAFLANMSHEIRTPMNAIIGFTELLGKHVTEPPYNDFLNSIKNSGKVLLSLINDLLDFEKIEAGKMLINKEWINFTQLVAEIKNTFSVLANEKQIALLIKPGENFPQKIYIDYLKINQILLNLVNNALKFTHEGSITIKYGFSFYDNDQEGVLSFTVSDTGIGIPENKRTHIFEPFMQGEKSTEKNYQGTGLGLSIVQKIVHTMGGNIALTSERDKGSTFSILIPDIQCSQDFAEEDSIDINDNYNISFNNELILIADSIQLNREVLYAMCRSINFTCLSVSSGTEVLEHLASSDVKLVIMDMDIDEKEPFHTIKKIRNNEKTKDIPVIAISTSQTYTQVKKAYQNDFSGFLSKPIVEAKLVRELEKYFTPLNMNLKESIHNNPINFSGMMPDKHNVVKNIFINRLIPVWSELSEILSSENLNIFTKELNELLNDNEWPDLSIYTQKLETAIKSYDFEAIQNLIASFNTFIQKVNPEHLP